MTARAMDDGTRRLTLAVGALTVLAGAAVAVLLGPRLGSGPANGPTGSPGAILDVPGDWHPLAWSPDGQRLLVSGAAGFALVGRGSAPPGLSGVIAAAWRPSGGHELAVIHPSTETALADLALITDHQLEPSTPLPAAGPFAITWSDDGRTWAVSSPSGVLVGEAGSTSARAVSALGPPIALSPDGGTLAGRDPLSGVLTTVPTDGGARTVLQGAIVDPAGSLTFSPDGRWLSLVDMAEGLRVVPASGTAPPTRIERAAVPGSSSWDPHADRLVALRAGAASGAILATLSLPGAEVQPLGPATALSWGASGASVLLLRPDGTIVSLSLTEGASRAVPLASGAAPVCGPLQSSFGALAYCTSTGLRVIGP